jgi:hypothetical protein
VDVELVSNTLGCCSWECCSCCSSIKAKFIHWSSCSHPSWNSFKKTPPSNDHTEEQTHDNNKLLLLHTVPSCLRIT